MFFLPIHAYEKDNLIYEIISENEASVSVRACDEGFKATSLVIPETIDIDGKTYTVTEVESFGFIDSESLVDVQLPPTLTSIGESAFRNCLSLGEISIPETVTTLMAKAFAGCISLKKANIPSK